MDLNMDLNNARQQCHHAVQLNTHLARGYVPTQADDSHTSLVWQTAGDARRTGALAGQWVDSPAGRFRLALRMEDLTVQLSDASGASAGTLALDGRSFSEAKSWLAGCLWARGLDPAALSAPLHFQLDDHPLAHGARFAVADSRAEFETLARRYATAATLLEERRAADPRASEVRCWPHHFDIATLITMSGGEHARTIGVGLSPGDHSFAEPYYYVSPYPYPEAAKLPALKSGGFWNTADWTGAVLLPRSLPIESIRAFLEDAVAGAEDF